MSFTISVTVGNTYHGLTIGFYSRWWVGKHFDPGFYTLGLGRVVLTFHREVWE